ncbi:hypothetical protein, partial [Streptomyces sp. NPDC048188]|uniref:hypothetical protein n=1 Tax=Streptomyces sp. NPDC048188 TaxID=3155749 RepID=UPI003441228E
MTTRRERPDRLGADRCRPDAALARPPYGVVHRSPARDRRLPRRGLRVLEGVQQEFYSGSGAKKVSLADLIVLGGS